ncbi:MAG: cytochrome c oxidase assembly protein [Dehalococcoidia bacterium]|nr:cytochrome c oxidase assembly protein [Dehalococcoidia bacterium]MYA54541.1 cytochrome c oxidase assembly protein [Dehalococcoidia bacterium]
MATMKATALPSILSADRGLFLISLGGLAAAIAATIALRAGDGGGAGWIWVCTWAEVPPPEFPQALFTFAIEPIPIFLIGLAAFWYLRTRQRAQASHARRIVSNGRVAACLGGFALVLFTVFGPIASYDGTFLTLHMVQHFILITIAPPLILLGAPMTLWLIASGKERRRRVIYPVLHAPAFRAFTHPLVGVFLFAAVPLLWYVTPAFEESLGNVTLHFVGYAIFLFAGLHYWWPIIGGNPTRWNLSYPVRLLYLLALVPIHAFLGLIFHEPDSVIYEQLAVIPRAWGPGPLLDQQIAGAIMFIAGEALGLIALLIVSWQWASHEERVGRRLDAADTSNEWRPVAYRERGR